MNRCSTQSRTNRTCTAPNTPRCHYHRRNPPSRAAEHTPTRQGPRTSRTFLLGTRDECQTNLVPPAAGRLRSAQLHTLDAQRLPTGWDFAQVEESNPQKSDPGAAGRVCPAAGPSAQGSGSLQRKIVAERVSLRGARTGGLDACSVSSSGLGLESAPGARRSASGRRTCGSRQMPVATGSFHPQRLWIGTTDDASQPPRHHNRRGIATADVSQVTQCDHALSTT